MKNFLEKIKSFKKIIFNILGIKKKKKLLIIGCGRSGTKYITELLKENGIYIGHEKEEKDGMASWYMTVDNEFPPFGPSFKNYKFDNILHQVRDPRDSIPSIMTFLDISWDYIKKYIPINEGDSKLIMASKYWYYWNILAQKKVKFTYRVEDIENSLLEIINIVKKGEINKESLVRVSKTINSRKHIKFNLEEIKKENESLYNLIIELARKYGYEV